MDAERIVRVRRILDDLWVSVEDLEDCLIFFDNYGEFADREAYTLDEARNAGWEIKTLAEDLMEVLSWG